MHFTNHCFHAPRRPPPTLLPPCCPEIIYLAWAKRSHPFSHQYSLLDCCFKISSASYKTCKLKMGGIGMSLRSPLLFEVMLNDKTSFSCCFLRNTDCWIWHGLNVTCAFKLVWNGTSHDFCFWSCSITNLWAMIKLLSKICQICNLLNTFVNSSQLLRQRIYLISISNYRSWQNIALKCIGKTEPWRYSIKYHLTFKCISIYEILYYCKTGQFYLNSHTLMSFLFCFSPINGRWYMQIA